MISRVGVTLGLRDLTPAGFGQVRDSMSRDRANKSSWSQAAGGGGGGGGREWADAVRTHLLQTWYSKLAFLRKTKGLKFVRMTVEGEGEEEGGVFGIDGLGFERAVEVRAGGDGSPHSSDELLLFHVEEVTALIYRASMNVQREIRERVDRDGWRALKCWVKKRRG